MKKLILIAVLVVMLVGCEKGATIKMADEAIPNVVEIGVINPGKFDYPAIIYRFIDTDMNCVCWVAYLYQGAGISCIPLHELETNP